MLEQSVKQLPLWKSLSTKLKRKSAAASRPALKPDHRSALLTTAETQERLALQCEVHSERNQRIAALDHLEKAQGTQPKHAYLPRLGS
jgi:hypothetical protein